jgi:hypothetical protein
MDYFNAVVGGGNGGGDSNNVTATTSSSSSVGGDKFSTTTAANMSYKQDNTDDSFGAGDAFRWVVIWVAMAAVFMILPFFCNARYRNKLCFYLWRPCGRVALVNPSIEEGEENGQQRNRAHIDTIFHAAVTRTNRRTR